MSATTETVSTLAPTKRRQQHKNVKLSDLPKQVRHLLARRMPTTIERMEPYIIELHQLDGFSEAIRKRLGKCFFKLKKIVKHGDFEPTCDRLFPHINKRSRQRYLKLYSESAGISSFRHERRAQDTEPAQPAKTRMEFLKSQLSRIQAILVDLPENITVDDDQSESLDKLWEDIIEKSTAMRARWAGQVRNH